MATASDSFAGTAGTSLDGKTTESGGLTWHSISGTWTYGGNSVTTSTAASSNPLACVTLSTGDFDAQITTPTSAGQSALYLRVQDANNWIRLLTEVTSSQTFDGTYTASGTICQESGTPGSVYYTSSGDKIVVGSGKCLTDPTATNGTGYWYYATDYKPNYTTTYSYGLYLEKCIAGTISTVTSWSTSYNTTLVRAVTIGSSISVYNSSGLLGTSTVNDFVTQNRVGVGRGSNVGNYSNPTISAFSVTYTSYPDSCGVLIG